MSRKSTSGFALSTAATASTGSVPLPTISTRPVAVNILDKRFRASASSSTRNTRMRVAVIWDRQDQIVQILAPVQSQRGPIAEQGLQPFLQIIETVAGRRRLQRESRALVGD